ncbi:MAG: ADOP family duplicated permease [Bryobacteraceae bacterium]
MAMKPQLTGGAGQGPRDEPDELDNRLSYWLTLFGRLRPGVTLEQAQTALNVAYVAQVEEDIKLYSSPSKTFLEQVRAKRIVLKPGQYGRGGFRGGVRTNILLLLGITGIVLLIACANVANLLLARASVRAREIALRLSLGATRPRLIRLLLAESWILAFCGGLAGIGIATGTLRLLAAIIPATGGPVIEPSLDSGVLLFSVALSLMTGLIFGLYPALHATRPDLSTVMKDQSGQSSSSSAANGFRNTLTVAQIAASMLLLVTAALFGRSLLEQMRVELGIRADHLISFSVDPGMNKYTAAQTKAFYERLEQGLAAIPGVRMVTSTSVPAIAGSSWGQNITVAGYNHVNDDDSDSNFSIVGPGYLRTMGTPLLAGREFTEADNATGQKVAIVNQTFAKFYFKDGQAIGRMFQRGRGNSDTGVTIVGVARDAKYAGLNETQPRVFYLPYRQQNRPPALSFYARTEVDPETIAPQLRRAVAALDPNLPIGSIKTMERQISDNLSEVRLMTTMVLSFAALATLLAAIGLYGVMAFNVARRTREIGIRMAIGATGSNVRSMILREAGILLAIGTALGFAAAIAAARGISSFIPRITAADPVVYVAAAVLLAVVALGAAYVPALRATRVEPTRALRYE